MPAAAGGVGAAPAADALASVLGMSADTDAGVGAASDIDAVTPTNQTSAAASTAISSTIVMASLLSPTSPPATPPSAGFAATAALEGTAGGDRRGREQAGGTESSDAGGASAVTSPAPTGDPAVQASPDSPQQADGPTSDPISNQVAAHLVRLVSSGTQEMVVRLRPAELGDVTVRIALNGRDVSAWFAAPQPQVQTAISAAMGQLQTSLGDAGYNLSGAWVGADGGNAQQQQR
jgi:flagellar hook-length control protein FliK